jgi:hypothetical protein
MLLELYELNRSLRAAGITLGATDNRIQTYPNRPALEVRVNSEGLVDRMSLLRKEQLEAIRKFECSTGGLRESTPGFNVDPLYRMRPDVGQDFFDEAIKDLKKKTKSITTSIDERGRCAENLKALCEPNWDFSDKSKISQCFSKAARILSEELGGATDGRLAPLLELLKRSKTLVARRLHEGVARALIEAMVSEEGGIPPDICLKMLLSSRGSAGKKTSANQSFSLILELDDASALGGLANHEVVWRAVNKWLIGKGDRNELKPPAEGGAISPDDRVGVFGETIVGQVGPMPERNLPLLGKVKLFSLSDQTPCQARYGLIESDACPVGLDIQSELASAMQWITEKEREDETWTDVSDSCGYNQRSLLVAYVTNMPAVHPAATGFFVRPSGVEGGNAGIESRFEARAKSLIEALQGMVSHDPGLSVAVMIIAKADAARKKLLYSRRFDVRSVIRAAQEWQEAARNYPSIRIRSFNANRKPFWQNPWTPYPSEVVRVVNTAWDADGEQPKRVSNAQLGLGLALLLETESSLVKVAKETLRLLVMTVTPVVLALGKSWVEGKVFTAHKSFQDIPLLIPATLGLALWKAGDRNRRGAYMSRNPYLIGQLLSLADEFHRNYCQHEREGKLPPRLIGNALMPTALERPTEGLARLSERFLLYHSVASKELRDRAGMIERAIDKDSLPPHCSDEDKAQMLLGYLARAELEQDPTNDDPATDAESTS